MEKSLWNKILDLTVLYSFDKNGFARHMQSKENENFSFSGKKKAIITGATSGIGFETAKSLGALGVELLLIGRDKEKAKKAMSEIKGNVKFFFFDMSDLTAISRFVNEEVQGPIDILIHNAGGMPEQKIPLSYGMEEVFGSQVIGPYLLTKELIEKHKVTTNARFIFVSSGGMYLQRLNLEDLSYENHPYNKNIAYANAKRAQVILSEQLAEKYKNTDWKFSAMHPGWADTPGVAEALPRFYRLMKNRLRTPSEGADTIIWLAMTKKDYENGQFWLDREIVPKYFLGLNKEEPVDLIKFCNDVVK